MKYIAYEIPISGNESFPRGGDFFTVEAADFASAIQLLDQEHNLSVPSVEEFSINGKTAVYFRDDITGYIIAPAGVLKTKGDYYNLVRLEWEEEDGGDDSEILESKKLNNSMAKNKRPLAGACTCGMKGKCKVCKEREQKKAKTVKESTSLLNFVRCVTEKNFAEANKYLRSAVEAKVKTRIAQCKDVTPF